MLSRIAQRSAATLSATFDAEPGSVTIAVADRNGGELVPDGTATEGSGRERTFSLPAEKTTELGRITATWSIADGGQVTTYHDVVGFHLISIPQLRRFDPLDDTAAYSDEALALGRDIATYALERACNRAFAPQLVEEEITARGGRLLSLAAGAISELVSLARGEDELDQAGLIIDPAGYLERSRGEWRAGSTYRVSYVHGEQAVDPRVARAVGLIAADLLFEDNPEGSGSALSPRATSMSTDDGTFSLVTAGLGGNAFSLPEVNAVVQEWRLPS